VLPSSRKQYFPEALDRDTSTRCRRRAPLWRGLICCRMSEMGTTGKALGEHILSACPLGADTAIAEIHVGFWHT
jgi:hypothetical protein